MRHLLPSVVSFSRRPPALKQLTVILVAIAAIASLTISSSALADSYGPHTISTEVSQTSELTAPSVNESVSAASLFTQNCAGCHANGGNVVRRGKSLKQKALKRYGYDSVTKISQIIVNGKGAMSAYGDRLTPEEIEAIAQYVKAQSETGWN